MSTYFLGRYCTFLCLIIIIWWFFLEHTELFVSFFWDTLYYLLNLIFLDIRYFLCHFFLAHIVLVSFSSGTHCTTFCVSFFLGQTVLLFVCLSFWDILYNLLRYIVCSLFWKPHFYPVTSWNSVLLQHHGVPQHSRFF